MLSSKVSRIRFLKDESEIEMLQFYEYIKSPFRSLTERFEIFPIDSEFILIRKSSLLILFIDILLIDSWAWSISIIGYEVLTLNIWISWIDMIDAD